MIKYFIKLFKSIRELRMFKKHKVIVIKYYDLNDDELDMNFNILSNKFKYKIIIYDI